MIAEIKALVVVTDRFGENFTLKPPLRVGMPRRFTSQRLNYELESMMSNPCDVPVTLQETLNKEKKLSHLITMRRQYAQSSVQISPTKAIGEPQSANPPKPDAVAGTPVSEERQEKS